MESPCKEFCRCIKAKIGQSPSSWVIPNVHLCLFSRRRHHPLVSCPSPPAIQAILIQPLLLPSNSLMPALTWNLVSGQVSFRLSAGPLTPSSIPFYNFSRRLASSLNWSLLRKAFYESQALKGLELTGPLFEGSGLPDTSLLPLLQKQEGG